jgi:uncharacterized protein YecT (DUF1311 family)
MHNIARALLFVLFVSVPSVAEAGSGGFAECANRLSTGEQKVCAEAAFKTSERDMHSAYQAAIDRASKADTREPSTDAGSEANSWPAAVTESQRAWEAYRDAECRDVVGYGEGSGRMVWVWGCLSEKNEERTRELRVPFYQR